MKFMSTGESHPASDRVMLGNWGGGELAAPARGRYPVVPGLPAGSRLGKSVRRA